jgi:putative membrane-bound dehydrogenase-like protein
MDRPRLVACRMICALAALALSSRAALAQKSPEETVKSMKTAEGLEVTLWASEPGMVNPTDMDVDERGRVWVLEGANYRGSRLRPAGDRIMVLEDKDQDGVCDTYRVFVQDPSLVSPLGVCKLGDKLYVSQSPNVLVYTIEETPQGPRPVGKPEIVFTAFTGFNHDHGVHAFVFGPDGRYYFNTGNDGARDVVKFPDGKPVVDVTGSEIGGKAKIHRGQPRGRGNIGYQEGLSFRWDPDAKKFWVLANNFRNVYELAVDAFGTVWQSDNDDDGNQGVRINYVMEGGNFGYKGPRGTEWGRDKDVFPGQTRQEAHWHLRWPGVVPNLLHTGGGSPTGICVYEGDLLGQDYRGAILHCDAGPNVVRAYIVSPSSYAPKWLMTDEAEKKAAAEAPDKGAGYKAKVVELVKASDSWFRPSDLCIAPDGAVYVCDWYDPGVGGHATGDKDPDHLRGRIYRLAPKDFKPTQVALDLDSTGGQLSALNSPNMATRYLGYTKLAAAGDKAAEALRGLYKNRDPRTRARALWLLARTRDGKSVVEEALKDPTADVRIAGIRAARMIDMDIPAVAKRMANDESMGVARELCLALQYEPTDKALPVLVTLADRYDGQDRWYLEALGIGAVGREKELLEAWEKDGKNKDPKVAEGIRWRLKKEDPGTAEAGPQNKPRAGADGDRSGSAAELPPQKAKDGQVLPPIAQLARLSGDAAAGASVFRNTTGANCIACHEIGNEGRMVGPPLTTVGQKLSKAQLYEAILYPSNAILMEYENWVVKTKKGDVITGLKVEDTPDHITIKDINARYHDIDLDQIERKAMQKISLMPDNLSGAMTMKELVDLVEYLSTLRNKA